VIETFADIGSEDILNGICFRWEEPDAAEVEVTDYH
jgi:hypothetical protein